MEQWNKNESTIQKKMVAQQLIMEGKTLKELQEMYPKRFSSATLSKWKGEVIAAKQHETLEQIAHVDTDTLERLALLADDKGFHAGAVKLRSVATGLSSLQRLEPQLHNAFEKAIKVVVNVMDRSLDPEDSFELKPAEFKIYMGALTDANTALFNRPNNVVNISQNQTNVAIQEQETQKRVSAAFSNMAKNVFGVTDTIEGEIE